MGSVLKTRIKLKTDIAINWTNYNPFLLKGELGYESDMNRAKIGDGVHRWNDLPYLAPTDYVKEARIESTMSEQSEIEKIPTSQAIISWIKSQSFSGGGGEIADWEDF